MKYPSYRCQKCGRMIGWLGRFFEWIVGVYHNCYPRYAVGIVRFDEKEMVKIIYATAWDIEEAIDKYNNLKLQMPINREVNEAYDIWEIECSE